MRVDYHIENDEHGNMIELATAISKKHTTDELEELARYLMVYCEFESSKSIKNGGYAMMAE